MWHMEKQEFRPGYPLWIWAVIAIMLVACTCLFIAHGKMCIRDRAGSDSIHFYIPVCRFGMIIADVGKSFIVIFRNGGFESVVYLGIHSFGTIMKSDINSI